MRPLSRSGAALALTLPLLLLGTGSAQALDGPAPALARGIAPIERTARTVTPAPVTFDDDALTFTIPASTGVRYLVDGEVLAAGVYDAYGPITVTAQAASGYSLSGTTTWSHAFPEQGDPQPFVDVSAGQEHEADMVWMYNAGISRGWDLPSGREYRPLAPVNRDAMAAFLYRMAGEPTVDLPATSPFADMSPGAEHYEAVIWAYRTGITTGWRMPDGTVQFRPTQPIARDAMAAFLYRFDSGKATAAPAPARTCFTDVPRTAPFAGEICWMKSTGLSTGWSDGTYRPAESVKRDAMAAFLHRYSQK